MARVVEYYVEGEGGNGRGDGMGEKREWEWGGREEGVGME